MLGVRRVRGVSLNCKNHRRMLFTIHNVVWMIKFSIPFFFLSFFLSFFLFFFSLSSLFTLTKIIGKTKYCNLLENQFIKRAKHFAGNLGTFLVSEMYELRFSYNLQFLKYTNTVIKLMVDNHLDLVPYRALMAKWINHTILFSLVVFTTLSNLILF